MVVYLDVLILENIIINSFLIFITSQFMKIKINMWRLVLAALFGSLYVILYLLYGKIFSSMIFKLLISFLMILITYMGKSIKKILLGSLILINMSMLLAGFCIFTAASKNIYIDWNNISYKNILLAIMLTYIISWQIFYCLREKRRINNLLYDVEIVSKYGNKIIKCFLDTGNNLKEPATKIPVLIINKSCLKEFNIDPQELIKIPYYTVGSYGSVLNAFMADYINIYTQNEIYRERAFIGITETKISKSEDYDGLLPRGLIIDGGIIC